MIYFWFKDVKYIIDAIYAMEANPIFTALNLHYSNSSLIYFAVEMSAIFTGNSKQM